MEYTRPGTRTDILTEGSLATFLEEEIMSYFKEMRPESQGVDSEGISRFMETMDRKGLELHRLMIIRHGVCIARASCAPYREDDLHPVYSFTKSFTSTAIGFAVQEGILSLEDKMVDFFRDRLPDPEEFLMPDGTVPGAGWPSDNAARTLEDIVRNREEVTIHHLLCMSCGHETEIEDRGETWIDSFLKQPFLYKPGTFYKYNTAGTNMLCAILKKRTGQDLTEFLKPRLFEPLGMGEIFCYDLPDSMHVQQGGSGMLLTLENMAKFTYFMLKDGHWEGRPILPGWYSRMGSKQIETAGDSEGHIEDWAQGYGYQCWIGKQPGSFRADGAFGQFGLIYPDRDLIIITNAATEQTQSIMDAVGDCLLPALDKEPEGLDPDLEALHRKQHILTSRLKGLRLPALKSCRNPVQEKAYGDMPYLAQDRCSGLEAVIGGAGIRDLKDDSSISAMTFAFKEDRVIWKVTGEDPDGINREYSIEASLENSFLRGKTGAFAAEYAATARWRSLHALEMEIRRMDAMSGVRLIFRFEGDRLEIETDETLMTDGGLGMVEKKLCTFVRG